MFRALTFILASVFVAATAAGAAYPIADAANKERRELLTQVRPAVYVICGQTKDILEKSKSPDKFLQELTDTYPNGTAFGINSTGRVVTAAHVIIMTNFCAGEDVEEGNKREMGVHEAFCALSAEDGSRAYIAKVLFVDPEKDIAVLQIQDQQGSFPFLELEESGETAPGDIVLSLGDPNGSKNFAALGMVSNMNYIAEDSKNPSVRFSMPILPGNSGGPLINTGTGKVVGMINVVSIIPIAKTSAIPVHPGLQVSTSIVYAVPAPMIKKVVQDLDDNTKSADEKK